MNSISETFKTNPISPNRIIPLDFIGAHKLPDSHVWTSSPNENLPPIKHLDTKSVPIINLNDTKATQMIRHACEEWGAFQITNHGTPLSLLEELEYQTMRLFTLPMKQKLRALRSPDGSTGYGLAPISRFFSKLMWSEGFSIMGSPVEHASQIWPHEDYTAFCDVMEVYQREMMRLSEKMMGLILQSLDLTNEDMNWSKSVRGPKEAQALFHLNSYPACPEPSRAMGLAPHTDSSLITLLYQSNTNGLEIHHEDTGWVGVPPVIGAIIVNVADLMHIVSNGRFKSALHRAVVNAAQHRISMAYFYGPPWDTEISPSNKLINCDNPPVYKPVTWKEYLDAKATYFNKTLDFIRRDARR